MGVRNLPKSLDFAVLPQQKYNKIHLHKYNKLNSIGTLWSLWNESMYTYLALPIWHNHATQAAFLPGGGEGEDSDLGRSGNFSKNSINKQKQKQKTPQKQNKNKQKNP